MLRAIGQSLGIKWKEAPAPAEGPRRRPQQPAELTETEKWISEGFVPGAGPQPVMRYDEVPITVRELIVQVKRGKV
jgi:hypothetical protein